RTAAARRSGGSRGTASRHRAGRLPRTRYTQRLTCSFVLSQTKRVGERLDLAHGLGVDHRDDGHAPLLIDRGQLLDHLVDLLVDRAIAIADFDAFGRFHEAAPL